MIYYLYNEKNKITIPLGETSFNKFYTDDGWYIFNQMVKNNDQSLYEYVIKCDDNVSLTIEDFLKNLENFQIKP